MGWFTSAWLWASGWFLGYAAAHGQTTISLIVTGWWVVGCLWASVSAWQDRPR